MTPAEIQTRIDQLEAQRLELIAQLNATMGAIQDCQFWLSRLAEPDGDADRETGHPTPLHAAASS